MSFQVVFSRFQLFQVCAPAPPCNVFRVVFSRSRAAMSGLGFADPASRERTPRTALRPQPQIGEYWQSRGGCTTIICKGYADPPSARRFLLQPTYRFQKGEVLGIVHETEEFEQFVSIRVPHPREKNMLIWVNVWGSGTNYAYPVRSSCVESWRRQGWKDNWVYIPRSFLTYAVEGAVANTLENNVNPAG